jgi:transposase
VDVEQRIPKVTARLGCVFRSHPICRKLAAVPGIGPLTATALLAAVGHPHGFQNGRHLAAWLGPVQPSHCSAAGRPVCHMK